MTAGRTMLVVGHVPEGLLAAIRLRLPAVFAELDAGTPFPRNLLPRRWSADGMLRLRHGDASHFAHYEGGRIAYVSMQIPTSHGAVFVMLRSPNCSLLDPSILPDRRRPITAMRRVASIAARAVACVDAHPGVAYEIMPAAVRGVLDAHGGGVRNRARLPSPIVSAAASCCFGDEGVPVDAPSVPDIVSLEILGDPSGRMVVLLEPIEQDGGDEPVIDLMRSASRMAELMAARA